MSGKICTEHRTKGSLNSQYNIVNQDDLTNVLLARWDPEFLKLVLELTADPETGKAPISQEGIAKLAEVSQKTISNLLNKPERDPAWSSVQKVGEALGIHFVADYNKVINNEAVLEIIKKRRALA